MRRNKEIKAILILGSNQGDRQGFLTSAIDEISRRVGNITLLSGVYESEAIGYDSDNTYLNQALAVETMLTPQELLAECQKIEKELGRVRSKTQRYTDRTIDIDILFYGEEIVKNEDLTIPHPEIASRGFVLRPLMDIIPTFIDPLSGESVEQMWEKIKNISF